MPGPQIVVEMDANEAKLWSAYQRIIQGETQMETGMKKVSRATNEAAKEQRDLERSAKRVLDSIATPQEKHNRRVAELNRLYGASKLSVDELRRALHMAEGDFLANQRAASQAGSSLHQAFGPAARQMIAGLSGLAGVAGLAKAWGLVKTEIEAAFAASQRAAQATMPLAEAQRAALGNLGTADSGEIRQFRDDVLAMSRDLGVSESDVYRVIGTPLSARGDLPVSAALRATRAALRIAPGDVGTATAYAGAALDLSKISGGTPEQSAAFLQAAGVAMRVADPGKQARTLAPALTAAMANQATMQSGAALFAALTTGSADVTGEQSKTATIAFTRALAEFLPKEPTMAGRISALQADTGLRKRFLGRYSFEKSAQTPIEQLLAGEGATGRAYSQYLATMPTPEQAATTAEQLQQSISAIPEQATAQIQRRFSQTQEGLRTTRQGAARGAIAVQDLDKMLVDMGLTSMGAEVRQFVAKAGHGDPMQTALRFLETQAAELRTPDIQSFETPTLFGPPVNRGPRERVIQPTSEQLRQAELIQTLVDDVRKVNDPQMSENNQLLREISGKLDGNRRPQVPAASASANNANRE